ncbi:MAG: ABC transporter ATP-binding protein [Planctomycetes bacterium]|nr:ABC transporter ATP-binding protein [Planctomycetota bacterium]
MIEVVSFAKSYGSSGGEHAVRELSFTVAPSDILGLVGPNGAGKTTTLRALAGILRPTSGQIRIGGFDVVKEPVRAKRLLALVPDTPNPYEMLTVREHLEFARLAYSVDDGRDPDELLARFELDGKRDELCGSLSRGMRQKLAICCALLHRPAALLLDEPLTGLDPHGTRVMRDAIAAAAAEGTAIVVSSHQLELVERVCTRVLLVKKGRKIVEGTLDEIRAFAALGAGATLEEVFFRLIDAAGQEAGAS